jgi:hypothetical protein
MQFYFRSGSAEAKAPDPNGYGSETLVFKTFIPNAFISAMTLPQLMQI